MTGRRRGAAGLMVSRGDVQTRRQEVADATDERVDPPIDPGVRLRRVVGRGWLVPGVLSLVALMSCSDESLRAPISEIGGGAERGTSVVLITLDTTRADHLQPYGAEDVSTPALAELAERGVVFERAYAVAPVTAPAHASVLTGLYPPRHGVRTNLTHILSDDVPTLAEWLSEVDYRTAAFVSALVLKRRSGLDQGFEQYDDDLSSGGLSLQTRMMNERPAAATTDRALAWLDALDAGAPYLLWVHYYDPHMPYTPPPGWAERYPGRPYDGEIAYTDSQVGRLLAHPRVADDGVMVLVVGDHGEGLGEHGEKAHGPLVYDSTLHVPLLLQLPGGPAGARVATPVSQVDLVPTILDFLDLHPKDGVESLEGQSLLPLLTGQGETTDRYLFAESELPFFSYGWSPLRTVRQGSVKYIAAPVQELYDLEQDPGERRNLAAGRTRDVDRLAAELDRWNAHRRDTSHTAAVDSETAEELRALGYVAGDPGRPEGAGRGNPVDLIEVHEQLETVGELLTVGRFREAEPLLRTALDRDPDNPAALRDLCHVLALLGQLDEAEAMAERAHRAAPWSSRVLYYWADLEFRRGRVESALELIERALGSDEHFLEARLERGRYLADLGRLDEARQELGALLESVPDNPWVAVRYAEFVELAAGDSRAAETRLRTLLARNPFLTEAWIVLGTTLENEGRIAAAAAVYREAVGRDPRNPDLAAGLALILATSGDRDAEPALREAIRLSPAARAALHVALARILAAQGRHQEAQRHFELAAGAPAFTVNDSNSKAMALQRLGRPADAESVWTAMTRDHPEYGPGWLNLASMAIQRGDWGDVERFARAAVERAPDLPAAWNNLGIGLDELGRSGEARDAYLRAIELAPDFWRARLNLGLLEEEAGRYAEAVGLFEQVLAVAPNDATAHFHLGSLYAVRLNDPKRARPHLEATIRVTPGTRRAHQAQAMLDRL